MRYCDKTRNLWGVAFRGGVDTEERILYSGWAVSPATEKYPGEPSRTLLFRTRKYARDWCRETMAVWKSLGISRWRVRPVRVTETVEVEES